MAKGIFLNFSPFFEAKDVLLFSAAAAKSLQSCPTLWDPTDSSPPGSSIHGIFPGKSTGVGCHCLFSKPLIT